VELAQCEGHPREYSLVHLSVIRSSDKSYCKRQKGEETKLAPQVANMSSSLTNETCPQSLLKYLLAPRNQTRSQNHHPFPNSGSYTKSNQIFSFYSYSLLTHPKIGCVFRPDPFISGPWSARPQWAPTAVSFLGCNAYDGRLTLMIYRSFLIWKGLRA
jgi:hypothetical protein